MAETTRHHGEMTREETASYLRSIAEQLESDSNKIRVPVGNKRVSLSPPPDAIDAEAVVTERSRRLRKDTEELALTLKWNPTKDTAESDDDSGATQTTEPR